MFFGCGFVKKTSFISGSGPTRSDIPWWDDIWTYRRILTFYNSGQNENLTSFPLLVRLNSSRISYGATQDNGEDLRFIDEDGSTVLDTEIEVWNESGESVVWVNVPQIATSSMSDYLMMYYWNSGVLDGQDAKRASGIRISSWSGTVTSSQPAVRTSSIVPAARATARARIWNPVTW